MIATKDYYNLKAVITKLNTFRGERLKLSTTLVQESSGSIVTHELYKSSGPSGSVFQNRGKTQQKRNTVIEQNFTFTLGNCCVSEIKI